MREAVREAFHVFSEPLEGRVTFMYLDSAEPVGFVTIGVGNLIDPAGAALGLPFVRPDGTPATRAEIFTAWALVKGRQDLKRHGGMVFGGLAGNTLRLTPDAIDRLVERKLDDVDRQLAAKFCDWPSWCCDAQLALLSWAWAVGANAKYPAMIAALRAGLFKDAADECVINPKRGTIVTRNARNRVLLRNAGVVLGARLDPTVLHWPADLDPEATSTRRDMPNPPSSPAPEAETGSGPTLHVDPVAYFDPEKWAATPPDSESD